MSAGTIAISVIGVLWLVCALAADERLGSSVQVPGAVTFWVSLAGLAFVLGTLAFHGPPGFTDDVGHAIAFLGFSYASTHAELATWMRSSGGSWWVEPLVVLGVVTIGLRLLLGPLGTITGRRFQRSVQRAVPRVDAQAVAGFVPKAAAGYLWLAHPPPGRSDLDQLQDQLLYYLAMPEALDGLASVTGWPEFIAAAAAHRARVLRCARRLIQCAAALVALSVCFGFRNAEWSPSLVNTFVIIVLIAITAEAYAYVNVTGTLSKPWGVDQQQWDAADQLVKMGGVPEPPGPVTDDELRTAVVESGRARPCDACQGKGGHSERILLEPGGTTESWVSEPQYSGGGPYGMGDQPSYHSRKVVTHKDPVYSNESRWHACYGCDGRGTLKRSPETLGIDEQNARELTDRFNAELPTIRATVAKWNTAWRAGRA